ncbi:ATP-binding protein [Candidatus Nitrosocosmicus hydrocola]|uniref:ATP-binding protein n=1 Tax=Candidatus Nitrosocosmicus hydrocola TaxID=1826872 RepID=UPI0011E5CC5D|nr:ATP-binding protein [Candidatus Nitrosocosmicus hydrocola]
MDFTVEDNDPGIRLDKIDSLFRKFYQIDTSLTRKHGETGLGLVICKVLLGEKAITSKWV